MGMDRFYKVLKDPDYIKYSELNKELEIDRIFCKHSFEHSLDVARILYILVLEEKCEISKDLVYATAFLHDLGRYAQYKGNVSHHSAGADIAKDILARCEYSEAENEMICDAILAHHTYEKDGKNVLKPLLYKADKQSRQCFNCKAYDECYWEDEQKNNNIIY